MKKILFFIFLFAALSIPCAECKIAENGKAHAGILIPQNACPIVKKAAEELAAYLKKMTGAEFSIGTQSRFKSNFKLGFGNASDFEPDEYVIRSVGPNIEIYGKDSRKKFSWFEFFFNDPWKGTLRGVFDFLDMQGVRWVQPGLEYVPQKNKLVISEMNIHRKPAFSTVGDISTWNFYKVYEDSQEYGKTPDDVYRFLLKNGSKSRFFLYGCHTEYALGLHKDPQWLSDQTHLQMDKEGNRHARHSCWTHPDVQKTWLRAADGFFSGKTPEECGFSYMPKQIPEEFSKWPFPFVHQKEFMIDPMDSGGSNDGRCWCDRCNEFRRENPCSDDTDLLWNVIGKVAEEIKIKHPGKYITTLVYPPKQQLPKRKLPDNIRVRICLSGPKIVLEPELFKAELKTIHDWYQRTGNKPPLWVYHCVHFADSMPHIPEIYPHLIAKYIKSIRKDCSGMFMETHAVPLCYTRCALDTYIFRRFMNNPDLDVDREIDSYCQIAYGPAAADARLFFNRLEKLFCQFWRQTVTPKMAENIVSPWGEKKDEGLHAKLWEKCYTSEEMQNLDTLLRKMENKSTGTKYIKHVILLRKYFYDSLLKERNKKALQEDARKSLKLFPLKIKGLPSEETWKKAVVHSLIQADPLKKDLSAAGSFKILLSENKVYLHAKLQEPIMKQTYCKQKKNGNKLIWQDNCVEFFFYSVRKKLTWHLIVNDKGIYSMRSAGRAWEDWGMMPECHINVRRNTDSWQVQAEFPLSELLPKGGELRFNMTRERRIQGQKEEFSTWSPLAKLNLWLDNATYGTLIQ